ncbi:MAG TPA: PAS domain-containing sensor histidine kinase [Rubricoccaceae bacterium]|jgi:PAS domain S-box-containing protein
MPDDNARTMVDFDYQRFFELSPDLLCIAGSDGYFKRVNPAVSALLGYSDDELYSRPIDAFVHPDDQHATRASRQGLVQSTLRNFENRYLTKRGDVVWLAWTSQLIEDSGLIFAVAKNVTHRKRLEAERVALLDELTKVNSDLKALTLTTSHDLRSPLNNLLLVSGLLDLDRVEDPETVELIEVLRRSADVLHVNLNKYVDALSGPSDGSPPRETVSLSERLRDVSESISSLIDSSNATLHSDFSRLDGLALNEALLDSILLNLITNAIKYARPGVPPVITIGADRVDNVHRLVIGDNGLGIDLAEAEGRLFGLNQTFHSHTDSKGVGLYLVHRHVTSLGGHISVASTVGDGTTFTISFPV